MMKIYLALLIVFATSLVSYAQPIFMKSEKEGVWIKDGNQKVFFYQKLPKSLEGKYSRSNYLHPIFGIGRYQ